MNVFSDPRTNAYLRIGRLDEACPLGERLQMLHYTILVIGGGAHSFRRDNELLLMDRPGILTMTPGTLFEFMDSAGATVLGCEFNRQFYCVEYHDAEVSCNGLLFNGAMHAPVVYLSNPERASVEAGFRSLQEECSRGDALQFDMLRVHLKQLIITSTRVAKRCLHAQSEIKDSSIDLVRQYSALVEKHFHLKHKVTDYASMLNRSPKTIINVFARLGGRSALQVIHDRLALEAQRLLLLSDMTAKEIAFTLGFNDPSQFNRFVKKMTGRTTKTIREAGSPPAITDSKRDLYATPYPGHQLLSGL